MSAREPIPRKSNRLPLDAQARMRPGPGRLEQVRLSNISAGGCCIAFAGALEVGQMVIIQPGSLDGLMGRVRWVKSGTAGIEFDHPLYQPVVDHLHRNQQAFAVL